MNTMSNSPPFISAQRRARRQPRKPDGKVARGSPSKPKTAHMPPESSPACTSWRAGPHTCGNLGTRDRSSCSPRQKDDRAGNASCEAGVGEPHHGERSRCASQAPDDPGLHRSGCGKDDPTPSHRQQDPRTTRRSRDGQCADACQRGSARSRAVADSATTSTHQCST